MKILKGILTIAYIIMGLSIILTIYFIGISSINLLIKQSDNEFISKLDIVFKLGIMTICYYIGEKIGKKMSELLILLWDRNKKKPVEQLITDIDKKVNNL